MGQKMTLSERSEDAYKFTGMMRKLVDDYNHGATETVNTSRLASSFHSPLALEVLTDAEYDKEDFCRYLIETDNIPFAVFVNSNNGLPIRSVYRSAIDKLMADNRLAEAFSYNLYDFSPYVFEKTIESCLNECPMEYIKLLCFIENPQSYLFIARPLDDYEINVVKSYFSRFVTDVPDEITNDMPFMSSNFYREFLSDEKVLFKLLDLRYVRITDIPKSAIEEHPELFDTVVVNEPSQLTCLNGRYTAQVGFMKRISAQNPECARYASGHILKKAGVLSSDTMDEREVKVNAWFAITSERKSIEKTIAKPVAAPTRPRFKI
jgi:hypothetical protein